MYKGNKIIAIIPARKGSKRVKNKNLYPFKNKPLIYHTIVKTLKSKLIDKIIVSSNDLNIIKLSKKLKVSAPFKRPNNISGDRSTASEVVNHCLDWLNDKNNENYDYIIYLQPTSPNRKVMDIDNALKIAINKKINTLVSATKLNFPYEWAFSLKSNQNFYSFKSKDISKKKSQDYKNYYHLNGAIFIANVKYFKRFKTFHSKSTYIFKTTFENSFDIDNYEDFRIAERF